MGGWGGGLTNFYIRVTLVNETQVLNYSLFIIKTATTVFKHFYLPCNLSSPLSISGSSRASC